ncbi:MAG: formate/nitrite transporter family protein [Clostridia bacterium]|nr:formate/nitrite transporter family protein [Clostridia bacterium]
MAILFIAEGWYNRYMFTITTKIKYLDNLLLGILAGIAIGFGGFLNLLMVDLGLKFLGGFLFSIGLFTVCFFGLHLYTGRIGYVIDNKFDYCLSLLIMYIGNIIGAVGFGYLLRVTGIATDGILFDTAPNVAMNKIIALDNEVGQTALRMIIYSFFCGIMVFLAVDIFKKSKNWVVKVGGLVICVALFVITGMEHCIADMFYFALANSFGTAFLASFIAILLATIGNSFGAIASRFVVKTIEGKS